MRLGAMGARGGFSSLGSSGRAGIPYASNLTAGTTARMLAGYQAMQAGTKNMNIAVMEDSTGRGVDEGALPYNSQYPLSIAEQIASALRGDGIASGANNWYGLSGTSLNDYVIRDRRITVGGTAAVGSSVVQGGAGMSMSSSTATMTFTPQGNCTKADIYTLQNSAFNGAQLAVLVDGVATATITQNTTNTIRKTTVSLGSAAPHTITINWVSGANALYGIDCYDDTRKEVTIRQWAQSGGTASQMIDNTGSPNAGRLNQLALFPVDLVIGDVGIVNSWRNGTAVATVKTQVETLIDAIHAAGGDFIFLEPPFDSGSAGNTANQQLYVDAVNASCIAKGCGIFRTRQALVSKAASDAAGYTRSNDFVHYTIAGQAWRAGLLKPVLRYGMGLSPTPSLVTGGLNLSGVLPMDIIPTTWTEAHGVGALTSSWQAAGKNLFDLASGTTITTVAGGYPDVAALATALGISPTTGVGGAAISKWYDQSGNGRDLTQATAANRPWVAMINGQVFITTDGWMADNLAGAATKNRFLTLPSVSFNNQSLSFFAVTGPSSSSAQYSTGGLANTSAGFITTGTGSGGFTFGNGEGDFFCSDWTTFDTIGPAAFVPFLAQKSVVGLVLSASSSVFSSNEKISTDGALSAGSATGGNLFTHQEAFSIPGGLWSRTQAVMISPSILTTDQQAAVRLSSYSAFRIVRGNINILIDGASVDYATGAYLDSSTDGSAVASGYGWDQQVVDGLLAAGKSVKVQNTSSYGLTIAQQTTNWPTIQAKFFDATASKNILLASCHAMHNSFSGRTGAEAYSDLEAYITAAKAAATAGGGAWDVIFVFRGYNTDYDNLLNANAATLGVTVIDTGEFLPEDFDTNPIYTYQTGPVAGHYTVLGYSKFVPAILPPLLAVT
jgi:hypothetical protein